MKYLVANATLFNFYFISQIGIDEYILHTVTFWGIAWWCGSWCGCEVVWRRACFDMVVDKVKSQQSNCPISTTGIDIADTGHPPSWRDLHGQTTFTSK